MTVKEVIEHITDELYLSGLDKRVEVDNRIIKVIDREARETALKLRIPVYYYKSQATGTNFVMPANALSMGLLYVESELYNTKVPVVTIHQANQQYQGWEENEIEGDDTFHTRLLVYDPKNKDQPVYAIGFETGETIRMQYVGTVNTLSDMSDNIWDGFLSEYHHVIVYKILGKLAFGQTQWYQVWMNKANELEETLFNHVQDVDWNDTYYA